VKSIKGTATKPGSYAGTVARVELVTVPLIATPALTRGDVYTFIRRAIHLAGLGINFVADIDRTLIAINKIVQKLRRT
jgi:hypothetical protein